MARNSKPKEVERNYRCVNYRECLAQAAIHNSNFNCANCDRAVTQSFNDLLKNENLTNFLSNDLEAEQAVSSSWH
ncbi:hypothetical protein GMMP15_780004 [Candidatus Magnetomoraceae bacterium gMMP-15]